MNFNDAMESFLRFLGFAVGMKVALTFGENMKAKQWNLIGSVFAAFLVPAIVLAVMTNSPNQWIGYSLGTSCLILIGRWLGHSDSPSKKPTWTGNTDAGGLDHFSP